MLIIAFQCTSNLYFLLFVHVSIFAFSLPAVVRGLTADFVNASTLRISWDAASPDQNVTGYDVIVVKENTSESQVAVGNSTSSVVVLSLDQCDNYTVRVASNSSFGLGNYSTFVFVTRCGGSLVLFHLFCHVLFLEHHVCKPANLNAVTTLSRVWLLLNKSGSCFLF